MGVFFCASFFFGLLVMGRAVAELPDPLGTQSGYGEAGRNAEDITEAPPEAHRVLIMVELEQASGDVAKAIHYYFNISLPLAFKFQ